MKKGKTGLWINCIAIGIAVLFFVLSFWEPPKTTGYDIVFLGDSIVGNVRENGGITDIVEARLERSVFNGAFGGTTYSFEGELLWGSFTSTQWSMVKLADAIAYGDWQSQLDTMDYADFYSEVNAQALPYFADRMQALSEIDFSKVKVLVIEHGTNDYNCGRALDNGEDLYDITTFGGAVRHSLRVLQEKYPQMQLVLLSPLYCELGENREKQCYNWNSGYGTLDDYIRLEKEIAAEFGVAYIDAYHESGIWEENAEEYLYDGLHLTPTGVEKVGEFVADKLSLLIAK